MGVTWGVTFDVVPTRGNKMKNCTSKTKANGNTDRIITARNDEGKEQGSSGKGTESPNRFARSSRLIGTLPKGPRVRANSCPELNVPLRTNTWNEDQAKDRDKEREKRKSPEEDSSPPQTEEEKPSDREKGFEEPAPQDEELFAISDSCSPEQNREVTKKKEQVVSMTSKGFWGEVVETAEETAMANGLRQMLARMENMADELSYLLKKNPNTEVKIKKLARAVDILSQNMSRKGHKYFGLVRKKLRRKSSDKEKVMVSVATQVERESIKKTASEDKVSGLKEKIGKFDTFQEIETVLDLDWPEEVYRVRVEERMLGETSDKEDIVLVMNGPSLKDGFGAHLAKVYPELGSLEEEGFKMGEVEYVASTTKVVTSRRASMEVERSRHIYLLPWGKEAPDQALHKMAEECMGEVKARRGANLVVIASDNVSRVKVRKIFECVSAKRQMEVALVVPPDSLKPRRSKEKGKEVGNNKEKVQNAAVIVKTGASNYSDMLKKVKGSINFDEIGVVVDRTRKTNNGDLLLILKSESDVPGGDTSAEQAKKLKRAIQEKVGVKAIVAPGNRSMMVAHINGIDGSVTPVELEEVLKKELPDIEGELKVNAMWPAYGGNQNASIALPRQRGIELVARGTIRIGWTNCRVKERVEVAKCYKCWEYGHLASACKGVDRKALCMRCGEKGHKAKECQGGEYCHTCQTGEHRGGTTRCPAFRMLLRRIT